jgi:HEAT repeat protein
MPVNLMWLAGHIAKHPDHVQALPILHDMIADTEKYDHHARHIALRALRLIAGKTPEQVVVQRATELLEYDYASNVRYEAVRVLTDAGMVGLSPAILAALDTAATSDEDQSLRQYAAEAAAKLRSEGTAA